MQEVCTAVIQVTHLKPHLKEGSYISIACCTKTYLVVVKLLFAFSLGKSVPTSTDSAQSLFEAVNSSYCRYCVDHLVDVRILPEQRWIKKGLLFNPPSVIQNIRTQRITVSFAFRSYV